MVPRLEPRPTDPTYISKHKRDPWEMCPPGKAGQGSGTPCDTNLCPPAYELPSAHLTILTITSKVSP